MLDKSSTDGVDRQQPLTRRLTLLFWWPAKRRRWRTISVASLFLAALAVGLVVVLASGRVDRTCAGREALCGIVINFAVTATVALAGYLYFAAFRWRRTVGAYIKQAHREPERLFAVPPHDVQLKDMVGREDLYSLVAEELRSSPGGGPHLVLGDTGSGKTVFLLGLTSYLARRGAVPIPISLRNAEPPLSLRALARTHFLNQIDGQVRSEGEADRIWRSLSAEGSTVVLADGLDEATQGLTTEERSSTARATLELARQHRTPMVVTSRQEGAPPDGRYPQYDFAPLSKEDALVYIRRRSRPERGSTAHDDGQVLRILDLAEVAATPFYLNIIAAASGAGRLGRLIASLEVGTPGKLRVERRAQARVALLDDYVAAIVNGSIRTDPTLTSDQREKAVANLERVAGAMTLDGALTTTMPTLVEADERLRDAFKLPRFDLTSTVDDGARLGLIQLSIRLAEREARFSHAILQAYFTQRLFNRHPDTWKALLSETATTEFVDALEMWCLAGRGADRAEAVAGELRSQAERQLEDAGLRLVTTAATVVGPLGNDKVEACVADLAEAGWEVAAQSEKLATIPRLGRLDVPWSWQFLFRQTNDVDYAVRWAAAEAIVEGGADAYRVLQPQIAELMGFATTTPPTSWRDPRLHQIAVLGWILPSLATETEGPTREELRSYVRELIDPAVARPTVEASLAQGFKMDAIRHPHGGADRFELELLASARYWYSGVVLLQAMCIRCIDGEPDQRAVQLFRERATRSGEHPFVRAAARLCRRAVEAGTYTPYIWVDDAATTTRSGTALHRDAAQLVGDIVLLLNLTEQGDRYQQLRRLESTSTFTRLPACLGSSRTRAELDGECPGPPTCPFELCPYPAQAAAAVCRGALGQAFCQNQSRLVHQRRFMRRRLVGAWQQMNSRAAVEFWERMADRARP
jgi:hypothetical protein